MRRAQEAIANPPADARLRLLLAEILLAQRKIAEAEPLLDGPSADPALDARRLIDLAESRFKSNRRPEALRLLDQARIKALTLGDADLQLREAVLAGPVLAASGDFARAKASLRRAADLARARPDSYQLASALLNLSFVAVREARFEDALDHARHAVRAAEPLPARRILNGAYGNLSLAYAQLGQFEDAAAWGERAAGLQRGIGDWPNLQHSLGEAGNLLVLSGQPAKAVAPYLEAHALARKLKDAGDESKWAGNLAAAYVELRDWPQAARWNDESTQLKTRLRDEASLPHARLNQAAIDAGQARPREAEAGYRKVVAMASGNAPLLWAAHAGLARLLAAGGRHQAAETAFRDALAVIRTARLDLGLDEFRITFLSRLIGFYDEFVAFLISRGQVEEALRVVESSRANVLAARLGKNAPPGKAALPRDLPRLAGVTVLSYWIGPGHSHLWIADQAGVRHAALPPRAEIAREIRAFRRSIEHSNIDPLVASEAGSRLFRSLVAPARIAPGSRVIVVPDGPLHELNLEMLPVLEPKPHYWIEDVTLAVAPSASLISAPPAAGGGGLSALLIGDPESADARYPRLEHASAEIAAVSQSVKATVVAGRDATPAAYFAADPQRFDMIHFAAHAESNPLRPLDSAIILSNENGQSRLLAREILARPINARLVTLSACRSAGARSYSGEGFVGFAWAFLNAGAQSVVASLWDVGDQSTAAMMRSMYARVARGDSPAAALRAAKLELLHSAGSWKKPYYWGAFQPFILSAAF